MADAKCFRFPELCLSLTLVNAPPPTEWVDEFTIYKHSNNFLQGSNGSSTTLKTYSISGVNLKISTSSTMLYYNWLITSWVKYEILSFIYIFGSFSERYYNRLQVANAGDYEDELITFWSLRYPPWRRTRVYDLMHCLLNVGNFWRY